MSTMQDTLPFVDLVQPDPGLSYAEQARQFADANPTLMRWFADQAFRYRDQGRNIGMKALVEAARWEWHKTLIGARHEFKLNNNLTSYLARILMDRHPGLDGFFATREIHHG